MWSEWLIAVSPLVGLASNVLTQITFFRLSGRRSLLRSVVIGFGTGMLIAVLLSGVSFLGGSLSSVECLARLGVSELTTAALGYGYFHFINLGETARRIRLLREFVLANEPLDLQQVLERYNAAEILRVRLGRLEQNGQVVRRNGRFLLGKPTVLRMANLLVWMKWILLGRTGEIASVREGP